jgi:hypothetical protein
MKAQWILTFTMALLPLMACAQGYDNSSDGSFNSDPEVVNSPECQGMKKLNFQVDGQSFPRYSLPELRYLKC